MLHYLLDEHVPHAVAQGLRRRGIQVLTAAEASLLGAPDRAYLDLAMSQGRVLVTHDADFPRLHQQKEPHAGIAFCEQGLRSIGELVARLLLMHEMLDPDEMTGRIEFL